MTKEWEINLDISNYYSINSIEFLSDVIFIGTNGSIFAFDSKDGNQIWKLKLPSVSEKFNFITINIFFGLLFIGSNGILYSIDPSSGKIFWKDSLTGNYDNVVYPGNSIDFINFNKQPFF
jgi:outer membrane protein assembly factor BamB